MRNSPDCARQEPERFSAPRHTQGTAVTVIDFTAFIGRLATASGETILPFFRTSLSIDNKSTPRFRSGDRGRPRGGSGDAPADQGQLPPARHRRRGIRQRARGRRICLGAGSDRRHQILHRGLSDLGHADRAAAQGHAGVRHDAPALYRRALFRRQRLGALFRVRRASANWRCGAAPRCRKRRCSRPARC